MNDTTTSPVATDEVSDGSQVRPHLFDTAEKLGELLFEPVETRPKLGVRGLAISVNLWNRATVRHAVEVVAIPP